LTALTRSRPALAVQAARVEQSLSSWLTVALAAALPLVFLHVEHQPGFDFGVGSTSVHLALSDLAVLGVGVLATVVWLLRRTAPLLPTVWIALAVSLFLGWIFASCFYPLLGSDPYTWRTHLVAAGKFAEYVLIAWAVLVLVRRRGDLDLVAWALVLWSAAASLVAVLQIVGVHISSAWPAGRRQPSFLGHHDFAALSGVAASLAIVAIALPGARVDRRLAVLGGVSGVAGLIVSGSSAGAIGFALAAVAAAIVVRRSWRRVVAILAIAAVAGGGVVLLRGGDIASFLHFLGVGKQEQTRNVETYTQRTVLVYIGWRIFLDHPAVGVGWDGSAEQWAYGPYLADAHREFPSAPDLSFPSPAHPWGVQNAYVQALSDLGVVGTILFLGLLALCLVATGRRALRAPPEAALVPLLSACWLLVAIGVLSATGFVAGIPTDGVIWLSVGLAATATVGLRRLPDP
jgi:O-antigen ligase